MKQTSFEHRLSQPLRMLPFSWAPLLAKGPPKITELGPHWPIPRINPVELPFYRTERQNVTAYSSKVPITCNDFSVLVLTFRCRQQSLSPEDDALTLDKCEEIFNTLQEDYYEEFKVIEIIFFMTETPVQSSLDWEPFFSRWGLLFVFPGCGVGGRVAIFALLAMTYKYFVFCFYRCMTWPLLLNHLFSPW